MRIWKRRELETLQRRVDFVRVAGRDNGIFGEVAIAFRAELPVGRQLHAVCLPDTRIDKNALADPRGLAIHPALTTRSQLSPED